MSALVHPGRVFQDVHEFEVVLGGLGSVLAVGEVHFEDFARMGGLERVYFSCDYAMTGRSGVCFLCVVFVWVSWSDNNPAKVSPISIGFLILSGDDFSRDVSSEAVIPDEESYWFVKWWRNLFCELSQVAPFESICICWYRFFAEGNVGYGVCGWKLDILLAVIASDLKPLLDEARHFVGFVLLDGLDS